MKLKQQAPEVFCKKRRLKNCAVFTGKNLCWSLFLVSFKVASLQTLNLVYLGLLLAENVSEKLMHKEKTCSIKSYQIKVNREQSNRFRSCHQRRSVKKMLLNVLQYSQEILVLKSFFNKVGGLKKVQHRCFPVNLAIF